MSERELAAPRGSAFHVGQSVRVLESIYDPPSGETPGGTYALRGEIVVVRHIGEGTYPIRVSHPNRKDDNTFSVSPKEIEPWVEPPNKDSTTPVAERGTTGALTDRPPEAQ